LGRPCIWRWKITVKDATHKYWEEKWEKEKSEKSTMKFLDIKTKSIGNLIKNLSTTDCIGSSPSRI
jgi:hypothetical protein